MAGKSIPEKGGFNGVAGVAGGSAKGILLVLLALAVCFGYFYYFTDLLRPKEETPLQSEVYPAEVKKPLPDRTTQSGEANPGEGSATVSQTPAPSEQPAAGAASQPSGVNAPQVSANTQARQVAVPVAPAPKTPQQQSAANGKMLPPAGASPQAASRPTTAAAAKPKVSAGAEKTTAKPSIPVEKPGTVAAKSASKTVKQATANQKTSAAKTAAKEPVKSSSVRKEAVASAKKETAAPAGKTAGDKKQKAAAATGFAAAKSGKPEAGAAIKTSGKQGGDYTLIVGTYVMKSTLLAAKAKLELAGFKPVVTPGRKKSEPMNRLLLAEFASYSSASSELKRVKKSSRDAFILQENGKYALYAGSYFDQGRASQEQDRLRKEGFAPIVKKSSAPVMTYTLSSGDFATRAQAEKEAARLRKLGFKPLPAPLQQ